MPKKKRTRKDKMQTDIKRQSSPSLAQKTTPAASVTRAKEETDTTTTTHTGTFSLPENYASTSKRKAPSQKIQQTATAAINTSEYGYLRGDLVKTTILTTVIIAAELFVYFFLMK